MRWSRVPKLGLAALALLLIYGLSAALGLEDWVGVLSGTPVPGVDMELAAIGAALHVLSWFGAVVLAPILGIAAALLELVEVIGAGRGAPFHWRSLRERGEGQAPRAPR